MSALSVRLRTAVLLSLVTGAACNVLWGVEDLSYEVVGGGVGAGSQAGAGGTVGGHGGQAVGGSGGDGGCGELLVDPLNCGVCGHDCLGGDCAGGQCQPVALATGQVNPGVLLLRDGLLFWSNSAPAPDGAIVTMPAAGGQPSVLAGSLATPLGIWLDGADLYYAATGDGTVHRLPIASPNDDVTIASSQSGPAIVMTDPSYVYWSNYGDGTIRRSAKASPGVSTVASYQLEPQGLWLVPGWLYWANVGTPVNNHEDGQIRRIGQPGQATPETVADGQYAPQMIQVWEGVLYWTNLGRGIPPDTQEGSVLRAALDGSQSATLATGMSGPTGLAIDDTGIYVALRYEGRIVRLSHQDGVPETLYAGAGTPHLIALDPQAIYWSNGAEGTIMRLAK